MKKKKAGQPADLGSMIMSLANTDTKVFAKLPNLVAHLSYIRFDDGSVRRPGRIFLKVIGVTWVVTLKDYDAGLELDCCGSTLDEALACANVMLGADDAPWVVDSWQASQPRQKKKG